MRLEQLEYLIEIHKTHSINLASSNLHVTQQNISQSIQKLESELGLALLERSSQGTFLTSAGLTALKHAQKIFYELSVMKSDMSSLQSPNSSLDGTLHLMYTNGFSVEFIYNSLDSFSKNYPNVKISVQQNSLASLLSALYNQEITLGFITSTSNFHLSNTIENNKLASLSIHPLKDDYMLAAVSYMSPLATQKSISITKLLQHQLIFLQQESTDATTANWLFHYLSKYGIPKFQITTNAFELYIKAISDNHGIGFFTRSSQNLLSTLFEENIILLPIRPTISLFQGYVLNKSQPLPDVTSAYLPYIDNQI